MKQKCKVYGWSGIDKSPFYKLASVVTTINDKRKCKKKHLIKSWGLNWDKVICKRLLRLRQSGIFEETLHIIQILRFTTKNIIVSMIKCLSGYLVVSLSYFPLSNQLGSCQVCFSFFNFSGF